MARSRNLIVLGLALLAACDQGSPGGKGPEIDTFTANPSTIAAGDDSTLSWSVADALSLQIDPGAVDVTGTTTLVVSPALTTSYRLTASNANGTSEASTTITVAVDVKSTSVPMEADTGGTVELEGATLIVPPGALNQDTVVTLQLRAAPVPHAEDPMQPSGPQVTIDLGGALLNQNATLEAPFQHQDAMEYVVTERSAANATGGAPETRVHAVTPISPEVAGVAVPRAGAYTVRAIPHAEAPTAVRQAAEGRGGVSLQVPFYWQAGLPWCAPTSLAMTLNYFQPIPGVAGRADAPSGRVANYTLAGLINQDATSGASAVSLLNALGVPKTSYSMLSWDADLIPSAPFTSYVILAITGAFGFGPQRPLWTSSDRLWHAFVITGLSADGVHIADSNARWNGVHPSMSWQAFRDSTCKLADPDDPSKGCSGDQRADLWTMMVFAEPRPESERRGSIELAPNGVYIFNPSGWLISESYWDGLPYDHGYYFYDVTGKGLWPIDAAYGRRLPRSSDLHVSFNVVNVTESVQDYSMRGRLYVDGALTLERNADLTVGAYARGAHVFDFGNLGDVIGAISGPVTGRLELELRQAGVLQDAKHVSFRLGPDPTDGFYVSVRHAGTGVGTLKDVPVTLTASAFDRYSLPTGEVPSSQLLWTEGGTMLGSGADLTVAYETAGSHHLKVTGVSEYGATAVASVDVNVLDPVRNPGEVVIDYPSPDSTLVIDTFGVVEQNLVGHATYTDGGVVPEDRLSWTWSDGRVIGTGSSTVVDLPGYCSTHTYIINLTARKLDGSPVGTAPVAITVVAPPC